MGDRLMIRLTRPDGAPFLINADAIETVFKPVPGVYEWHVNSVVQTATGTKQGVRETVAEVEALCSSRSK